MATDHIACALSRIVLSRTTRLNDVFLQVNLSLKRLSSRGVMPYAPTTYLFS